MLVTGLASLLQVTSPFLRKLITDKAETPLVEATTVVPMVLKDTVIRTARCSHGAVRRLLGNARALQRQTLVSTTCAAIIENEKITKPCPKNECHMLKPSPRIFP